MTGPKKNRPEEALQRTVADFLDWALPEDAAWFHVPNQRGTRKRFENELLKALGVKAGVPDCVIVWRSRALFIELKAPGNSPTDVQKDMHARLRAAGSTVFVCKSLDEVIGVLTGLGMRLKARAA